MNCSPRRHLRTVAAGLLLGLLTVVMPRPVVAASAQSMTVTPSTGLHARQSVQIHAVGFSPHKSLIATECIDHGDATGQDDCTLSSLRFVTSDAAGVVDLSFVVSPGPIGLKSAICGHPTGCILTVSEETLNPSQSASAPISFSTASVDTAVTAPPATDAPSAWWVAIPAGLCIIVLGFMAMRRRDTSLLPLTAGGLLLVSTLAGQAYAFLTARSSLSGESAGTVYAKEALAIDTVAVILVAAAVFLHRSAPSRVAFRTTVAGSVVSLPVLSLWAYNCLTSLLPGAADEGGGIYWLAVGLGAGLAEVLLVAFLALAAFHRRAKPPGFIQ